MSLCESRMFFETKSERRSQDSGLIQTLHFLQDSDVEDGDFSLENLSSITSASAETPLSHNSSDRFCDSGLGSPTPKTGRRTARRSPRSRLLELSPIPFSCGVDSDEDDETGAAIVPDPIPYTPPHKKFRALRLYDTPHTPKSLLQKAQRRISRANRNKLCRGRGRLLFDREGPQTNINPFTVTSQASKRTRLDSSLEDSANEDLDDEFDPFSKTLPLHEINTSRYNEEFYEICKLGGGNFGCVYKCIHRLDGCTYAIKKSKTPVAGSAYERAAMNEVYAHAVLGKHQHVVRYYSAWAENDYMFIQNEYCNGGSLAELIARQEKEGVERLSEDDLKQVLLQVAQGLRYIHSQHLVHLDIKPGNVFIHCNPKFNNPESGLEEDIGTEDEQDDSEPVTYKIGDLGHVTSIVSPQVEEGDCRYLPTEILQEHTDHLPKADIFSLALTIFATGGGGSLPKNGPEWHSIRRGDLPYLPMYSQGLNALLKLMIHPDPRLRPSAATLVQHPVLCPNAKKTMAQLRHELNEERFKNGVLSRQLQEARSNTKTTATNKRPRLVGGTTARSLSLTCF